MHALCSVGYVLRWRSHLEDVVLTKLHGEATASALVVKVDVVDVVLWYGYGCPSQFGYRWRRRLDTWLTRARVQKLRKEGGLADASESSGLRRA